MKMKFVLPIALLLAGCGVGDPSKSPHSVEEYLANDQLSADTLEACRPKNAAERRIMEGREACRNVRAAERQRSDAEFNAAIEKDNAEMEKMMEERRAAREQRGN